MTKPVQENEGSGSTTWEWRRVRIGRPAGGQSDSRSKTVRWFHRSPWNPRKPLTLTVHYRGGAEAWVEVRARGSVGRFHGSTALIDALHEIWALGKHPD